MKLRKSFLMLLLMTGTGVFVHETRAGITDYFDAAKERCIRTLPENQQEKARRLFWPTVICAAVACTVVCYWINQRFFTLSAREAFTDMTRDLLTANPLKSDAKTYRNYTVEYNDGAGSIHYLNNGTQFYARFLRRPWPENRSELITASVNFAMQVFNPNP